MSEFDADLVTDVVVGRVWLDVAAEMFGLLRFSALEGVVESDSEVDVPDSDLDGLMAEIGARRARLVAEIDSLSAERLSVNERIKAKRQELGKVERMWRSTKPRKR